MADSKISALTDGGGLLPSDELPIARGGTSVKIKGSRLGQWTPADSAVSAGSFDEEMSAAINGAWTWSASSGVPTVDNTFTDWPKTNPTVPRYSVNGYLPNHLVMQPLAGQQLKVYRAMPTGYNAATKWVIGAKVRLLNAEGNADKVHFVATKDSPPSAASDEGTDSIVLDLEFGPVDKTAAIQTYYQNAGSGVNIGKTVHAGASYVAYFAISQDTNNDLYVWASLDGIGYVRYGKVSGQNVNGNVNNIYISVKDDSNSGTPVIAIVDWIHFRLSTVDPLALFLT